MYNNLPQNIPTNEEVMKQLTEETKGPEEAGAKRITEEAVEEKGNEELKYQLVKFYKRK